MVNAHKRLGPEVRFVGVWTGDVFYLVSLSLLWMTSISFIWLCINKRLVKNLLIETNRAYSLGRTGSGL